MAEELGGAVVLAQTFVALGQEFQLVAISLFLGRVLGELVQEGGEIGDGLVEFGLVAGFLQIAHLDLEFRDERTQDRGGIGAQGVLFASQAAEQGQYCFRLIDLALLHVGTQSQAQDVARDLVILHRDGAFLGACLLDVVHGSAGEVGGQHLVEIARAVFRIGPAHARELAQHRHAERRLIPRGPHLHVERALRPRARHRNPHRRARAEHQQRREAGRVAEREGRGGGGELDLDGGDDHRQRQQRGEHRRPVERPVDRRPHRESCPGGEDGDDIRPRRPRQSREIHGS